MEVVMKKGTVKECCTRAENLVVIEALPDGTRIRRCKVCGCRHFRAVVEGVKTMSSVPDLGKMTR